MLEPTIEARIDQFAALYSFALDEFQREAIRTLISGISVMVAAPTGTGKTVVAEWAVYDGFRGTGRTLYTTPIKALSNQKFRDLRALYGKEVGLLTGDITENREARVLVMTTEILRNMLLQSPWELDDVNSVIFDEVHYLADPDRGTTWEESIILCPDHVQLVCLSATVSNAGEIAAWTSRTHRPIRLVTHTERAVPLSLSYFLDGELHEVVDYSGRVVRNFPHTGGEARKQMGRGGPFNRRLTSRNNVELDEPQPREIIDALAERQRLPAIYFLFSRNDCQAFAERLALMRPNLISKEQAALVNTTIDTTLAALRPEDRALDQVQTITNLAMKGIGFHHAGLLPILKQLVEVLFSRGLMLVVFATDTLALGVNMPARTVVIGRMTKWDGRRRRALTTNEFQQMAGRAGRRGMDQYGHVVVPYSPWITFRETLEIGTGPLLPIRSAFAIRYNTVLNLWDPPQGERVRHLLVESLAQFQAAQRVRQLEEDIIEVGGDILGIPHGCLIGLNGGDELLEDYRSLVRTLTAAQGKERRLRQDLSEARQSSEAAPWTEPGRQVLRRVFRTASPGLVVHLRDRTWATYLGRHPDGGVGLFLLPEGDITYVREYRDIDYLPDAQITLPQELHNPPPTRLSALEVINRRQLSAIKGRLTKAQLPDLDGWLKDHLSALDQRFGDELREKQSAIQETQEQIAVLHTARDQHPCHTCPRREEHRAALTRIDQLVKERQALEELLARETDAEDIRIRGVIRGIREILTRFGYLHRGYPTPKADMLAEIFDNDGLILCEAIDNGWLDRLPPEDLAEVFSWFSFDRDFRYANHFTLPNRLVQVRRRLEDLEHNILGEERDHGLFISEGHNQNFYGAARAWCLGASMASIAESIELSEGDLVMTFNKTIDLMRQVREMLISVDPQSRLRHTLGEAEKLLRRGIVEQSLVIGLGSLAPIDDLADQEAPEEPEPEDEAAGDQ